MRTVRIAFESAEMSERDSISRRLWEAENELFTRPDEDLRMQRDEDDEDD